MTKSSKKQPAAEPTQFNNEQFIWRFSPNQTTPDLLEAITVGREALLQNVIEKIIDSATSSSTHHLLLHGPRGIGKSHFISLLNHRLRNHSDLSESIRIAKLNEDETTTSMAQFLVRIYRALCLQYPDEYSVAWLNEVLDQSPNEISAVLTRRLIAKFEQRKLVILIENLDSLFEHLGLDGQHELRTLLQEQPFACLIATSPYLFKAVHDRSEPFFGFFQQIPLRPLSLSDAQQLLIKIAATKEQTELVDFLKTTEGSARIHAIHDLAGGNHRVFIVLSGFATRETLDQLVGSFQQVTDNLTPYYQERLRWISPLQRQIVELLCRQPGTVNPKEIARQLLVDQRSIGKQVRILEEIGYLTSTKRGRETYYELREPMMRTGFEVKEQSILGLLMEFLRIWHDPTQHSESNTASSQRTNEKEHRNPKGVPTSDPQQDETCNETVHSYETPIQQSSTASSCQFSRSTKCFSQHRWDEGFAAVREALEQPRMNLSGNPAQMFAQIFQLSEDSERLNSRINTLIELYKTAARKHREHRSANKDAGHSISPLSHLAIGLVKSLPMIDASRMTTTVLMSLVAAVEQHVAGIREFQIPLRLFRYGIRYLISGKESEFVELIQPERKILLRTFGLDTV